MPRFFYVQQTRVQIIHADPLALFNPPGKARSIQMLDFIPLCAILCT